MNFSQRAHLPELAQWCRRLATALGAGLDLRLVCQREADRGSAGMRRQMQAVARGVAAGDSLAECLRRAQGYFPVLLCEMVSVGDQAGRLETALFRMATHYDHLIKLRRKFVSGITWPLVQLFLAVLVVGLLIWVVGAISDLRGTEPIDVLGLGLVGNRGLAIYALGVSLVAAAIVALIYFASYSPLVVRVAVRVPLLGHCLRSLALARLSWTLAMSHEAGIDARKSVAAALRGANFHLYTRHQQMIDRTLAEGHEVHEALRKTGEYPPEFLDALENAEQSGQMSEVLLRLADDYQEQAHHASARLAGVAAWLVWAVVAGLIIAIVFRLFSFYVNAINDALNMNG